MFSLKIYFKLSPVFGTFISEFSYSVFDVKFLGPLVIYQIAILYFSKGVLLIYESKTRPPVPTKQNIIS